MFETTGCVDAVIQEQELTNLNGVDAHVNADFLCPEFLESSNCVADVIQVFDWTMQALHEIFSKLQHFMHQAPVLLVCGLPEGDLPGPCLHTQTQLQFFCPENATTQASDNTNKKRIFLVPHLERAQGTYKKH